MGNIIRYAADDANIMMGSHNSVQICFEAINLHIFIMKCICHSAAILASNACTKLTEAEEFVCEVYSYFNYSAKSLEEFSEF